MSKRKLGAKPTPFAKLLGRTGRSPLSSTDSSSPGRGGRPGADNGAAPAMSGGQTTAQVAGQAKGETDG